jgi:HlyD family secretion protein
MRHGQLIDRITMRAPNADIDAALKIGDVSTRGRLVRWLGGAAIVVVVAMAGTYLWSRGQTSGAVEYLTQPVTRGTLVVTVTATGTVQPTNEVQVGSELSGIVRSVSVDYNDEVRIDDVLAQLDTDKLELDVTQARANLTAAKARVADAEATLVQMDKELARVAGLVELDWRSGQALEIAQANRDKAAASVDAMQAQVGVAEADLKIKETSLAKASIRSPVTGVVLQRNVDPGQTVAASFQAPVLFVIAEDLRKMELEVDVDEADVGSVTPGQVATFSVEAFQVRRFPARIHQLRYASQTVEGVVTYKAVLTIDNTDLALRPGMTATADIVVQSVDDAILVPNAALRFAPTDGQETSSSQGGGIVQTLMPRPRRRGAAVSKNVDRRSAQQQVWILRAGEPVAIPVTIGMSDGARTQILDGELEPDQRVIVDTVVRQ